MPTPPDPDVSAPEGSPEAPSPPEAAPGGSGATDTAAPKPARRARTRRASRFGLLAVLVIPILEYLPAILNLVKYQPQATTSGIGFITKVGFLAGGQAFIDPNVGYNSQALGHAAALSWLHGHIPWWNLNEGLGMPLAASIQSASFFPLVLLQALPNGSMWFHLACALAIGWATFALLRELRCSPLAAAVGAIAFELNGSVAWITNAPLNPVAFLPLTLLGIEYVMGAAAARRRGGWILLSLGVCLSVISGFPEVAVLNTGLAALWFIVRLVQRRRDAAGIIVRAAAGVGVGLLLAAPVLNAFVRYLTVANVGRHTADVASVTIPAQGLAQLITPYLFGGIFSSPDPTIFAVWSETGGYVGATLLVLAVAGLFGARERALRVLLGAWALLFMGSAYNVPVLHQIVDHLPGLTHLAVFRYSSSSSLLCLCVLAAFFVDEVGSLGWRKLSVRLGTGVAATLGVFAVGFLASPNGGRVWSHLHLPRWYWGSIGIMALVFVAAGCCVALAASPRRRAAVPWVLGVTMTLEMMALFAVPILSFPREVHYDTKVVDYLRANLGTQRFFTVQPISPNYGTFFGIASLDAADLPVPANWATYVHDQLSPCVLPWQFGNGGPHPGPNCDPPVSPLVSALTNMPAYQNSAVRFLVVPGGTHLFKYFQPRAAPGAATPNGAAVMAMSWRPPTYLVSATLRGFVLPLPGGIPSGLQVKACSSGMCVTAHPSSSLSTQPNSVGGTQFALDAPLTLGDALTVRLISVPARPVSIMTVPSVPDAPARVVADGVILPDREALLSFIYDPDTLPVLVAHTESAKVYRLPRPSPIATAPGCVITAHSMTSFTTRCVAASTMTWRELSFPGWKATVNGQTVVPQATQDVFQAVTLPVGTATVEFSYSPPRELLAWLAGLLGVAAIAVNLVQRRSPGGSRRTGSSGGDASGGGPAP